MSNFDPAILGSTTETLHPAKTIFRDFPIAVFTKNSSTNKQNENLDKFGNFA